MTAEECFKRLGWSYQPEGCGFKDVRCYGELVCFGGWFGTEHLWCPICGKGMQHMLGLLPVAPTTANCVDPDDYDYSDGRVWVPENIWGLR